MDEDAMYTWTRSMPRRSNSFSSMAVRKPALVALKDEKASRTVFAAKAEGLKEMSAKNIRAAMSKLL
jgi:hypothetical protein